MSSEGLVYIYTFFVKIYKNMPDLVSMVYSSSSCFHTSGWIIVFRTHCT